MCTGDGDVSTTAAEKHASWRIPSLKSCDVYNPIWHLLRKHVRAIRVLNVTSLQTRHLLKCSHLACYGDDYFYYNTRRAILVLFLLPAWFPYCASTFFFVVVSFPPSLRGRRAVKLFISWVWLMQGCSRLVRDAHKHTHLHTKDCMNEQVGEITLCYSVDLTTMTESGSSHRAVC